MEEKEYKFDAFISYRHCELDKFVAENLHRILESYELPKNLKEKLNINGRTFKRIFRDQEELPLSSNLEDPIIDALNNSKYLIVICSPRLKESLWCKKEIETFKKIRGIENILCVLIEGEPNESFPEEVLYNEKVVTKNGKKVTERVPVEPLAADVRGKNNKEVLKRIKEEKLRLAAAMYRIDYDDLRQRHKLREQKRRMNIVMVVAVACLIFSIYSGLMLIKINNQQKILKRHQALSLSSDAKDYLNKDNRYMAIKSSYESLTSFNGVKMPYTSEGEYALSESLGVYDVGSSYKAVRELKTKGIADYVKSNYNNKYAAIYDESETITLFDSTSLKKIGEYDVSNNYVTENSFSFIGEDKFVFINNDGNISIINIKDKKELKEIKKDKETIISVKGEIDGKYLVYLEPNKLHVYDLVQDKEIGTISNKEKYLNNMYFSTESDYLFVFTSPTDFDLYNEDYINLYTIKLDEGKEVNNASINTSFIDRLFTKGDNAYILTNKSMGISQSAKLVSYNFKTGETNWIKELDKKWGKYIIESYAEGTNNVALASYNSIDVLNMDTGEVVRTFNCSDDIIGLYTFVDSEIYLVFMRDGTVNYANMEYGDLVEYSGKYELNIGDYNKVELSDKGFLLIPSNDTRVVLYEQKTNDKIKEEEITIDNNKKEVISVVDYETLKDDYNVKNRNIVDKMFYDTKKELLFVNYKNKDIAIYRVSDKTLLKTLTDVGTVDNYYGKDKYNRIYIGSSSQSYILDSNYNKVGHVNRLRKVDKDKLYIENGSKIYSINIYTLDDLLKEAKEYLK